MLELRDIEAGYGAVRVLRGVSLSAAAGAVTCVMGRNGAGKSTLMKAIMGLIPVAAGHVLLDGNPIEALPAHQVPRRGLAYVPQGRRLFAELTVEENLGVGLLVRRGDAGLRRHVLDLFPRLEERLDQQAWTLSGGEQQMLAIARALCLGPRVLLLDEPTEGLQPSMITLIRDTVLRLKAEGLAVVLVEQRVEAVLEMADQVVFMANGRVAETAATQGLAPDARQFRDHVGI
ncbi:branched-chain amino acid ABC transporter ATPase [Defluviimonas sp. 20V17]|uniref:ABC transporter ATP-binding protein n=1 Tax=Allgaiera indica TaxID=765699 RepID=A0AAN4USD7_9RHOB|nr:ABC transporter ATP-binding protein [Allgaiera indica]KDB01998.1 branched-chain amino acid ABC transporter ATPase [Defluviimonas sp. 20V17]GHE03261.1 ABC transporter ATP-binding protein [Allgaiera indica]SDX22465.1 amino acid/amide ABC transporter ATP-binding protein 2, HAAT family [Allgaiera indica]